MLHPGLRFLHNVVVPKLWQSHPRRRSRHNPEGPETIATGAGAVKFFVAFLEGFREEMLANPTGEVWHVIFEQGQHGASWAICTQPCRLTTRRGHRHRGHATARRSTPTSCQQNRVADDHATVSRPTPA